MAAITESLERELRELCRVRSEQDAWIRKVNKIHYRLGSTAPQRAEKLKERIWENLRGYYTKAAKLAEKEDMVTSQCIKELEGLGSGGHPRKRPSGNDSTDYKRKRVKSESQEPTSSAPFMGSPAQSPRTQHDHAGIAIGDQVAAKVNTEDALKDEWIVVKVTRIDREANRFEVIDEEPGDEEETGQRKYRLPTAWIIPFPKSTDPATAQDFPLGSQVLAIYPSTTALYKATVVGAARKRKGDDYYLEFDDDEEEGIDGLPQRRVPFYHVVQLPDGHRQ